MSRSACGQTACSLVTHQHVGREMQWIDSPRRTTSQSSIGAAKAAAAQRVAPERSASGRSGSTRTQGGLLVQLGGRAAVDRPGPAQVEKLVTPDGNLPPRCARRVPERPLPHARCPPSAPGMAGYHPGPPRPGPVRDGWTGLPPNSRRPTNRPFSPASDRSSPTPGFGAHPLTLPRVVSRTNAGGMPDVPCEVMI